MTEQDPKNNRQSAVQFFASFGVPKWLISGALTSVLALLMGVGIAGILYLFNLTSMVSVPLFLAAVVAVVAFPLVRWFDKLRVPRILSAVLVIVLIIGLVFATVQITINGVVSQAPAIGQQVTSGMNDLANYTRDFLVDTVSIPEDTVDDYMDQLITSVGGIFAGGGDGAVPGESGEGYEYGAPIDFGTIGTTILQGAGMVGGWLSGLAGGIFSIFLFLVFLFYFLTDYDRIRDWLSDKLFSHKHLGISVINDVTYSLSGYFRATTLTAIIVSIAIGIPLWLLGVPLIIPIIIITILTAYIPFLGALIASAFTVLIALASGGIYMALIAIVIMLIANNVLQTFVSNKLMGDYLNLHPLAVLIATLFGTVALGILGATFGAPLLAIGIAIYQRVQKYKRGELTEADLEERKHDNEFLEAMIAPIRRLLKREKAAA